MFEIIKSFPQDKGFKLRMLGWQFVIMLLLIGGYILPFILINSGNSILGLVGSILLVIVMPLVVSFGLYIYINRLIVSYYPHFKISFRDSIKKVIAVYIISSILMFGLLGVISLISIVAALINVLVINLIAFILAIIVIVQFAALCLGLVYTIFENVDHHKYGFRDVFKTYFSCILSIHQECVKICLAILIPNIVLAVIQIITIISVSLITLFTTPSLYISNTIFVSILFIIIAVWLVLTEYVYVFKKYEQVSELIEE